MSLSKQFFYSCCASSSSFLCLSFFMLQSSANSLVYSRIIYRFPIQACCSHLFQGCFFFSLLQLHYCSFIFVLHIFIHKKKLYFSWLEVLEFEDFIFVQRSQRNLLKVFWNLTQFFSYTNLVKFNTIKKIV